jgi:hypothetical protein
MQFKKYLAAALACAALVGCGGGSGPPPASDPTASAGVWSGATTDGRSLLAFLLSDETYWLIYGAQNDADHTAGSATGTASSVENSFRSTDGVDFNLGVTGLSPLSVDATFTPGRTFSGNLRHPNSSSNFITTFVDTLPSHLDNIAGNFTGQVATSTADAIEDADITIASDGAITGTSADGCAFTGTAASRSDIGVFNVTLTFGGGVCALGTSTIRGVAYLDDVTHILYSTAFNASRTAGFMAVAVKS